MAISYSKTSPYYTTSVESFYLGLLNYRALPALADDPDYEVNDVYAMRPDLLAADLYGDSALWWVFAVRNPNEIEDPVYDFVSGLKIKVPKKSTLVTSLGI